MEGCTRVMQPDAASPGTYLVHRPAARHPARTRTRIRARVFRLGSIEVQAARGIGLGLPAPRD